MKLYITEQGAALDKKARRAVKKTGIAAARHEGKTGRLSASLLVTDDDNIRHLNKQYRGIDKATDVLSFPSDEPSFLGDIAISLTRAKAQANEYGHSLEREMAFLVAHAMLHLMGYDHADENEEMIMREKQREILKKTGFHLI
ncbi:MAG: rRNA maturation RNase YbeY [Eubacteriales bacterium]|nr:rRNA maturation RNase YbeY [Eubacteriales bacterium]